MAISNVVVLILMRVPMLIRVIWRLTLQGSITDAGA